MLIADFGAASDVQLPMDRSGSPRGFAYVTFHDISDCQRAIDALDGVRCSDDCPRRLAVCLAESGDDRSRGRDSDRGRSQLANEAIAAATAMNAYQPKSGTAAASEATESWQPRSFSIAALSDNEGSKGFGGSTENAPDGSAANTTDEAAAERGFVYDEASGYYYDQTSGYFYDAATQVCISADITLMHAEMHTLQLSFFMPALKLHRLCDLSPFVDRSGE
jgi:RNA-binding protein 5/10